MSSKYEKSNKKEYQKKYDTFLPCYKKAENEQSHIYLKSSFHDHLLAPTIVVAIDNIIRGWRENAIWYLVIISSSPCTDLTASDSEGTLSAGSEDGYDSDATIPYAYPSTYRFSAADGIGDRESDSDFTEYDCEELVTHKYIADRPLAPLSSSFNEEDEIPPVEPLTPVSYLVTITTSHILDETQSVNLSLRP